MHSGGAVVGHEIRVFLLDGHRMFTDALAVALDTRPGLRCVTVAHSVDEGLRRADEVAFDAALVDLRVPATGGIAAVPGLLARRPGAVAVVLTDHPRADLARAALAAGATGFLGKQASLGQVVSGVLAAVAGQQVVTPGLDPDPASVLGVTPREHEVLRALSRGLDANRIAAALGISPHTTRDHIKSVMAKLGVRTQLAAVVTAARLDLVTVGAGF